jgi:kinesin family protein 20
LSSSASNVALSEGGVAGREAVYGDDTLAEADTIMSDDSLESRLSVVSDVGRIGGRVRYTIWASFLEIYNEQLYDLLVPLQLAGNKPVRRTALQLRDDRDGRPYVRGLREVHVASAEDAQRLLDIGRRNLHIASTRLNRASSRSHCIFTLKLIQIVDVANPSVARVASLSFCDLAGSERYQATCAFNERVKEAGNINSSLLTLGRCIDALRRNQSRKESTVQPAPRTAERSSLFSAPQIRRDGQSIAPFRESKLTRIFQNFLCGEGRVTMVINISQCSNVFDETLHALKYSALARQVVLIPSTNAVQSKPIHTNGERRTSSKRQTSLTALKTYSKKRKTEDLETVLESDSVDTVPASSDVTTSIEPLNNRGDDEEELKSDEDEDDCPDDDVSQESSPEGWKEQRQNMVKMIRKLEELLNEERQNSLTREARIRQEVCNEMQQQLVRIENEYQEGLRVREEICEEKFERKMEIYMEAVQKSCKRRRPLDEDEVLSGAGLQAKLSEHVETIRELETRNKELSKELADLHANFQKVCNERDMNVQRLTKAEFFASDAGRKLELLQTEAAQVLVKSSQQIARLETPEEIDKMQAIVSKLEEELKEEKSKQRAEKELKETVDELNGKIKDMECRHELTCRQLRSKLKQYENSAKASDGNSAITGLEVKNENVQIQEELLQLKDKLASSELAVHSLELERDSLQSQVKALHSQNEILMREAEDSKKSVELLTDEVAACKNELQNVRKSCDKDGDELQMLLSSKTSEFDAVKGDLEKKLRDALADQTEANSKLSNSVAVTNELESKLVAVRTELEQCQLEVTEKDEKLKQLEREARLKQEHVAQLEQTVFELTRKLSEAEDERKTEKEQWTTEVSSMKKKITDLEENLTSSEKDNDEAKLQTVLLQSELEANAHQLKALNGELIIMKEQISKGDERERELKSQLNVSTQLAKELQDKGKKVSEELEDLKATMKDKIKEERALVEERLEAKIKHMEMELSSKEKTLQTRYQTIDDLVEKMEKERAGYEIALRDAKSNETVIEQLKLTLSEQELTMQAQDRVIHERDAKVKSLEDSITRLHSENDNLMTQLSAENKRRELELTRQIESSQEQMKEKDIRLREIEKDLKKLERQKLSLEKDVCDVTSELRDCEHNLAERIHELKACQLELEKLRNSKEPNAKSLAKDLIQRDADLLSMRQQLAACNECCQSLREELDKVRERCINSEKQLQLKEQDFSKWRLERDALVTEINKSLSDKDTEIKRLKLAVKSTKRSDTMNVKSDEIEPLKRALNIKDQTIELICVNRICSCRS